MLYRAICHHPSVRLAVRLSVCLSVTRVDQSKTVEARIMQPSPQSSPMTLVSWRRTAPWNSKGKIGSGGAKYERGMKKTSFQPLPVLYSDSPGGAAIARWPSHQQGFLVIIVDVIYMLTALWVVYLYVIVMNGKERLKKTVNWFWWVCF